jgi:glutathione synthase/RimK-type ligase-like ATP-grasp enzyme
MGVLIITHTNDADSLAVKLAIEKLGGKCSVFYSNDLAGGAEWSYNNDNNTFKASFRGINQSYSFDDYRSVWMRRPGCIVPRDGLNDLNERMSAEADSSSFLNSILRIIERGKFVASPIGKTRIAQEKCYQFHIAKQVGLPMPATLISNSYDQITSFFESVSGKMIFKPLVPWVWDNHGKGYGPVRTTALNDLDLLRSSDLKSAPGIYQEQIEKKSELRVTILGSSVFAVEKFFPGRDSTSLDVDWRGMHSGAQYRAHVLCSKFAEKCKELLRALGLTMGVFDVAIDAGGSYFFLEVNPQGQFIWQDQVCSELNHLEAMAEFLLSADSEFEYSRRDRINLSEFSDREYYRKFSDKEHQFHYGIGSYGTVSVLREEVKPLSEEEVQKNLDELIIKKQQGLLEHEF